MRFINTLTPENTGEQTIDALLELVNPELTTILKNPAWKLPKESESRLLLEEAEGALNLRAGHGTVQNGTPFFRLDFDYFETGQIALAEVPPRVARYHDVIYRCFRWCIPEAHLAAFNPVEKQEV